MPKIPIKEITDKKGNVFHPYTVIDGVLNLEHTLEEIEDKFPEVSGSGKFIVFDDEGNLVETEYTPESFMTHEQGVKAQNSVSYTQLQNITPSERNTALSNISNRLGDSATYSYMVLLPNISFKEQVQNLSKTIFEIKDSFDLDGESVSLGTSSILFFNGGNLKNGTIVGARTRISSDLNVIFDNITLSGIWEIQESHNEWFVNCDVDECNDILKNNNSGFRKFYEDLNKWIMWNGTEWMNLDGSPITIFDITMKLAKDVTCSNNIESVDYGKPYFTSLTTISGYVVSDVVITMGESDITSLVYDNQSSTIYIPSVVGDINIEANKKQYFNYLTFTYDGSPKNEAVIEILTRIETSLSFDEGKKWIMYSAPIVINNNTPKVMLSACCNSGRFAFSIRGDNVLVSGDITSLINGVGGDCSLWDNVFKNCFANCEIESAPNLPSTTLAQNCYSNMFNGCTSLTTAPELPATTLAEGCYDSMFYGCTGLTTAPELPAMTLADYCYNSMFHGCTSLTTAPTLLSTTLTNHCYFNMFQFCTDLSYIKCLATDISATDCTTSWVSNIAKDGTFVKASSMNSWATGDNGIPSRWTVESE